MDTTLPAIVVDLEEQGIVAKIVKHKDGYPVLHCPHVGEHGIYLHVNFAIECCDNGYDEDECLEHLTSRLNEWE